MNLFIVNLLHYLISNYKALKMLFSKKYKIPEILAPAGNPQSLKAAVIGGADAVYMGINEFNARDGAQNFTLENIEENIDFAHLHKLKVFLTLNVPIKEHEIWYVLELINQIYIMGIDAIIIEDLGLITLIRKYFPDLPLHISTQVTVHNTYGVNFLEKIGVSRVVLARELNVDELEKIIEKTALETEIFVHGALCYSYSGRCLFSSFLKQSSANRGACTQPCRYKFKILINGENVSNHIDSQYPISCAELCTISGIKEIMHTGVNSFKIEGRMKKPEYVIATAKAYKKAVNHVYKTGLNLNDNEINEIELQLSKLFYRGFTKGFILKEKDVTNQKYSSNYGILLGIIEEIIFKDNNTAGIRINLKTDVHVNDGISINTNRKMLGSKITSIYSDGNNTEYAKKENIVLLHISLKTAKAARIGDEVFLSTDNTYLSEIQNMKINKMPIDISIRAIVDHELLISVSDSITTISYTDEYVVVKAQNAPTSRDKIEKSIDKLGDTPYKLNSLSIHIDENVFIPLGILNTARRNAIYKFEKNIVNSYKRSKNTIFQNNTDNNLIEKKYQKPLLSIYVSDLKSLETAVKNGANIIYILIELCKEYNTIDNDIKKLIIENNIEIVFVTPQIAHDNEIEKMKNLFDYVKLQRYNIACSNLGFVQLAIQNNIPYVVQKDFKIFNSYSANLFFNNGAYRVCLSSELNLEEIQNIKKSLPDQQIEVFIHGREQMLITNNDLLSSFNKNDEFNNAYLEDKHRIRYPIKKSGKYISIYDSKTLNMIEEIEKMMSTGVDVLYIDLSIYKGKVIRDVIRTYRRAIDKNKIHPAKHKNENIFKGHFFGGI